jgi:sec-independent protein translocase protein TatC
LFASIFFTSPYILYQIWKFISPGLYATEKKYVAPFVSVATLLFIGGILFGYFLALPPAFKFFASFSTDALKPMFSFREYISLFLKFLLAFGISFELPVFLFFMAKIGIVNTAILSKYRRYAILAIFVVAAILTPSPDAITQLLMAGPLYLLYEVGIFATKFATNEKTSDEEEKRE